MTVEVLKRTYTPPPEDFEIIPLTEDNVDEVALYVGSHSYHIDVDLKNDLKRVVFDRVGDRFAIRATLGGYLCRNLPVDADSVWYDLELEIFQKMTPTKSDIHTAAPYDR